MQQTDRLTPVAAARWLGVGHVTVYRLMHEGAIPFHRVGREYRIEQADLEAYVDAHHVEPGSLSRLYTPTVERRKDPAAD